MQIYFVWILRYAQYDEWDRFALDFLDSWLKATTIEVMAVWLCTAICPLQGNKTWSLLTKQGANRRVNCIPQNKLSKR